MIRDHMVFGAFFRFHRGAGSFVEGVVVLGECVGLCCCMVCCGVVVWRCCGAVVCIYQIVLWGCCVVACLCCGSVLSYVAICDVVL